MFVAIASQGALPIPLPNLHPTQGAPLLRLHGRRGKGSRKVEPQTLNPKFEAFGFGSHGVQALLRKDLRGNVGAT